MASAVYAKMLKRLKANSSDQRLPRQKQSLPSFKRPSCCSNVASPTATRTAVLRKLLVLDAHSNSQAVAVMLLVPLLLQPLSTEKTGSAGRSVSLHVECVVRGLLDQIEAVG